MNEKLTIDGNIFDGNAVATVHSALLTISGSRGMLGCGYVNAAAAAKFGDALAIVRGVKNFDDMLRAPVCEVSPAAAELGVAVGMSGKDALNLMK